MDVAQDEESFASSLHWTSSGRSPGSRKTATHPAWLNSFAGSGLGTDGNL